MSYFKLFTGLLFSLLLLFSCQQKVTNTDDQNQLNAVVSDQAGIGYQVNDLNATSDEIQSLTGDEQFVEDQGVPGVSTVKTLKKRGLELVRAVPQHMPDIPILAKVAGDSLIFFQETNTGGFGKRVALYYNFESGLARYYQVTFRFPAGRNLQYDSTEVVADLNKTLDNDRDDKLVSVFSWQKFKESFFVDSIRSDIEITDYEGTEPTGLTAVSDSYYSGGMRLIHKKQTAEMHPDNSGTLREDFYYKDGTDSYNRFTFQSDYQGTFEKKYRNGLLVSGSFNQLRDDNHGSYSELIDFPDGRTLDKITRSAEVWLELPDSTSHADYHHAVYFSSGKVDSLQATLVVTKNEGDRTGTLNVSKSNGAHGTIKTVVTAEVKTLTGNWTTWNNYYILISAEYYLDGSGHVHYAVYKTEDAYNNGDDPLLVADYNFAPDHSGNGTITHGDTSYDVTFDESGQGTISDGQHSTDFNFFANGK